MKVLKLHENAVIPTRNNPTDAGLDLYSLYIEEIQPGESTVIETGIAVSLPEGTVGLICDRSSLGKKGLKVMGGVIDEGYRGEIKVVLWNVSNAPILLSYGSKIAQMLIVDVRKPIVVESQELDSTDRGDKGFGSSGI